MAFTILNTLNIFIKADKDKIDRSSRCNVVYRIDCQDCEASYVGQTKRRLTELKNIKTTSTKKVALFRWFHRTAYKTMNSIGRVFTFWTVNLHGTRGSFLRWSTLTCSRLDWTSKVTRICYLTLITQSYNIYNRLLL